MDTVPYISVMSTTGVPLAGLTPQSSSTGPQKSPATPETPRQPKPAKNPFWSVGMWSPEHLQYLKAHIGEVEETTGDFTRKTKPNARYWKAPISFSYGAYKSRIIKMENRDVPFAKSTNYGDSYVYANLDRNIASLIQAAAQEKALLVSVDDPKVHGPPDTWWYTVS